MATTKQFKKLKLKIHGTHCASCEVLIERKFKKIAGVEKVSVNHATGKAELYCSLTPKLKELDNAIKANGYSVSLWDDQSKSPVQSRTGNTKKDYYEIGAVFLIIVAGYLLLKQFDIVPKLGITNNMSYGFVFLIGLVAAMSTCIAITGGLLLGLAAKYSEQHPNFTPMQKLKPYVYFNIGRIVSYTIFGGVIGALGSVLTLSSRTTGFVTIIASLVMILLGFQLLNIFPWLRRFQPKMPKLFGHKIHDLSLEASAKGDASGKQGKMTPFFIGAGTFFLPCGFTQALQLYVLSQGSMTVGALTMLAFSLGTLPALLSLSAISSFVKGAVQRYFLKFAGVLVLVLGVFNINNGFTLTGIDVNAVAIFQKRPVEIAQAAAADDSNVELVNGKQIVRMRVGGLQYSPSRFTIVQGVPVEWQIDGTRADGCAQVIQVPSLGITEYLPQQGVKTITFTPAKTGTIPFRCTMAMTTRGAAFTVVPNTKNIAAASVAPSPASQQHIGCNPLIMNCVTAQKLAVEISREKGFYPNTFTVKKGIPVELAIDAKVQLSGCMSTLIIPQYNVAQYLALGKSTVTFTPTKAGVVPFTCSMGSKMGQIIVEET